MRLPPLRPRSRAGHGAGGRGRRATALLPLLALAAATASLIVSGLASEGKAQGDGGGESLSPGQVEQVEGIIRDYLLENPELLVEVMRELERRQQAAAQQQVRDAIIARRDELNEDPDSPVGGNPEGGVTVVEFFDYQCPYCKTVAPDLEELLDEDDDVRFVYKEWPILGPVSTYAARAALAAREQGKYEPLHDALMAEQGRLTEDRVLEIAGDVGLDVGRLERDMDDPAIEAALQRNRELANALGVTGTPAFVIGDAFVPGAIGLEQMRSLVEQAREGDGRG